MLRVYIGTDRVQAREALRRAVPRGAHTLHLSDTSSVADIRAAAQGAGLFGEKKAVILDGVGLNKEIIDEFIDLLPEYAASEEYFFVLEEKPNAALRRALEKYATSFDTYDAPKKADDGSVFAISNALKRGDKKGAWVGYRAELLKGKAPEAVLGVLFWGAKDMFLKSREGSAERTKSALYIAALAELPHEARRRGVELEYALERFLLSL